MAAAETKIDPELQRQLSQAAASDEPLAVVLRLRSPDPARQFPTPDETRQLAQRLLDDAAASAGGATMEHNVLSNLGVLVLNAPPRVIRQCIAQHPQEIASATANRQPGGATIPPRRKRKIE